MSTRSRIAIKQKDNTYKSIYCHCDGYPEYNGVILYYHYSDPMKIKLLMSLGDISYLGENVLPDTTKTHTFDERQDDVTVAYHRDRGEDLHFNVFTDKDDLIDYFKNSDQDYLYLYENDKWYIAENNKEINLVQLEDYLLEKNYIDTPAKPYTYEDELAVELMNYARDFDPYEYKDIYSNDEDAFNDMKHNLLTSKDTSNMIDWLSNDINIMATEKDLSDKNMSDLSKQAFNLINKLNQHLKVLEKEETKEVDL